MPPTPQAPAATTGAKLSSDQFAQSIKAKYPAYKAVDNAVLTQKMLAKYPQYSAKVNFTPATPGVVGTVEQNQGAKQLGAAPGAIRDVAQGSAKGAIRGILQAGSGLAALGGQIEKGLDQTIGRVGNLTTGKGNVPTQTAKGAQQGADALTAASNIPALTYKNTAEKIGGGIGQVADLLVSPGGTVAAKGSELAAEGIGKVGGIAKDIGSATRTVDAIGNSATKVQRAVDAVNPSLTPTKLSRAYKDVVTGERTQTPASIFREQGLSADHQAINLGTRLVDLGLGKDPAKNLDVLGKALTDTETKLETALKGDPEINYNANKPELFNSLDKISASLPREFNAIKDNRTVFNSVVDFAKETMAKAQDTISGIRDGRTAFDAQAQREFPSAYKNGSIDSSTPAGRAIKAVRNAINEHLYNTAPNGSEIQNLIGREADIFRATENIAPKAAKGNGLTQLGQFVKAHPTLGRYLKFYIPGVIGAGVIGHEI